MNWPYSHRAVLAVLGALAAASVFLGSCADAPTSPHSELGREGPLVPSILADSLLWHWNEIGPATGGGGGEPACGMGGYGTAPAPGSDQAAGLNAGSGPGTMAAPPYECCMGGPTNQFWTPSCCQYYPETCPSGCESEPVLMADEYENPDYQNTLRPACTDFKTSGGSANFTWAELNGHGYLSSPPYGNPHYDNGGWGMINSTLTTGLEAARSIYNRGGIALSGGYRCPHGNAGISGAVANSYHTHGRAGDMYSAEHGGKNWSLAECELLRNAVLDSNPIPNETLSCTRYDDKHLHSGW